MKISRYFLSAILLCPGLLLVSCLNAGQIQNDMAATPASEISLIAPLPTPDIAMPEGWVLFHKPKENSLEAQCGNYSSKEWRIETENGRIKISPNKSGDQDETAKLPANVKEFFEKNRTPGNGTGRLHIEPFENGWLVGSDSGEWGGTLVWYSEEANEKRELIKDNIRGIARIGNETLVLSGLAHLSIDEGKLWKLGKDEKGEIKASLLKDLGSQPQGFVVKDKDLLVALNNKFLRVSLSGDVKVFTETGFSMFYPNSMTMDTSGVVYVGMRHFVVRFVPVKDSYREEWLVPQNCQKFTVKEMECVCRK